MDKVKINLFGESWSLKEIELRDHLKASIDKILSQSSEELSNLLLDLSFYEDLNNPEIKSISDLSGTIIKGLLNSPKSLIEIWLNGKKIRKIQLADIFYQNTLFELYQTEKIVVDFENMAEGIYLIEEEIGLVASYKFTVKKFSIDILTFNILEFKINGIRKQVLIGVFCNHKLLISTKSDTLLRNSTCINNNYHT